MCEFCTASVGRTISSARRDALETINASDEASDRRRRRCVGTGIRRLISRSASARRSPNFALPEQSRPPIFRPCPYRAGSSPNSRNWSRKRRPAPTGTNAPDCGRRRKATDAPTPTVPEGNCERVRSTLSCPSGATVRMGGKREKADVGRMQRLRHTLVFGLAGMAEMVQTFGLCWKSWRNVR